MCKNKDPAKRRKGNYCLGYTIQSILEDPINAKILQDELEEEEWVVLKEVKWWLPSGLTGKPRPPPKQHARAGPFVFLSLHLPSYEQYGAVQEFSDETIVKYRNALPVLVKEVYGENGMYMCGWSGRNHKQSHNPRQPADHFHILLSRLRFSFTDLQRLDEFIALPESEQPQYSQFFLVHSLLGPGWEIAGKIEKGWRRLLRSISGIRVPKSHPALVHDSDNEGQDVEDSKDAGKYMNRNAHHVFRKKWPRLYKDGIVLIDYLNSNKEVTSTRQKGILQFVRDDLLKPNHKVQGLMWPSYGFLRGSRFTPVIEAAKQLEIVVDGEKQRLLDQPVDFIHECAVAFRRDHQFWEF